jgi:hypothetical protein
MPEHTALDEFTLKNMINIDLNNIKKWGDTWLVKFNPNKTEIMIFNIRNQQDEHSFDNASLTAGTFEP